MDSTVPRQAERRAVKRPASPQLLEIPLAILPEAHQANRVTTSYQTRFRVLLGDSENELEVVR